MRLNSCERVLSLKLAPIIKKVVAACFVLALHLLVGTPSSSACQAGQNDKKTESDSTLPEGKATEPSRWRWSLTIRNRTGFRLDEPRVFQMSRTLVDAKVILKFGGEWRLTAEGRAHYDPVYRLGYPRKVWLDPRQFIIDGRIKGVGLSLGLQQIVWGQADGLRILDVINPLDYREFILEDFLDSRRPLWAVRADIPIEKGSLQLIWVPYFVPGRLPAGEDEFGLGPSFGLGLIISAIGRQLPPDIGFTVRKADRPPYRVESSQLGGRYRRSLGRWDLTANYFYGWEDVPTPYLRGSEVGPNPGRTQVIIGPRFDRKVIFGGTAATNFGPVVLRMEAGWSARKSAAVNTSPPRNGFEKFGQFSSVVGLDYSPRSWLWMSGQYFLQFTSAPQRALLFPRYDHLASFLARTNFFRDTLRPEIFVLTGLNQRQYMVRPRVTRTFGDHWSVGLGVDLLGGNPINPFGYFRSRERVVAEVKWTK